MKVKVKREVKSEERREEGRGISDFERISSVRSSTLILLVRTHMGSFTILRAVRCGGTELNLGSIGFSNLER